jgi:hypothetical protein
MSGEENRMETRLRLVLPAWTGLVVVVMGALLFFASYFLLPVAVVGCFDSYCGWVSSTTWQFSLAGLSSWEFYVNGLPQLDISLVTDTIVLVLYYLPLLAAATVAACSVGFLVWPHRALAVWGHRAWAAGSITLILMLCFVSFGTAFFGGGPQSGFLGLLVGYGVLWAGNRVFRTAASVT